MPTTSASCATAASSLIARSPRETTEEELIELLVGRAPSLQPAASAAPRRTPLLDVVGLQNRRRGRIVSHRSRRDRRALWRRRLRPRAGRPRPGRASSNPRRRDQVCRRSFSPGEPGGCARQARRLLVVRSQTGRNPAQSFHPRKPDAVELARRGALRVHRGSRRTPGR